MTMQVDSVPPAPNVKFEVGTWMDTVEPFKHLLCATAHSKNSALELQAPMGEKGYLLSNSAQKVTYQHFDCKLESFCPASDSSHFALSSSLNVPVVSP